MPRFTAADFQPKSTAATTASTKKGKFTAADFESGKVSAPKAQTTEDNSIDYRKLAVESQKKAKAAQKQAKSNSLVKLAQGAQSVLANTPAMTPIDQRLNLFPNNEKADDRKYIGANLIPAYEEDSPLKKVGKGIVNYGVGGVLSLLGNVGGAPQQAMMQTSRAGTNAVLGKTQQTSEMTFGKDLLGAKEDNLLTQAAATALDPATYFGGGIVDDLSRAGIMGKASKPSTEMVQVLGESQQKLLAKMRGALKGVAQSADEVIPLEKVQTVKPSTKQGTFKIKNTAYDDVAREYNEAIETIQNHFRTNELRIDEIPLIKSELGIDLDDIINRMEIAEKGVSLPGADAMRLKRTAGAASDRAYDIGERAAGGKMNIVKADNVPLGVMDDAARQADNIPLGGKTATGATPKSNRIDVMAQRAPALNKSKFASDTIVNSKNTKSELAGDLKKLDLGYDVATNRQSLEQANKRISDNAEDAVRYVLNTNEPSAEHTTTAIQLINKFQNEGNYERAVDIASDISSKLTKNGQAIQAASIYDRLSPEGILVYAQRQVNKLNDSRWFKGLTKEQKINPELAKQLKELSENVKNLTGDAKIEASQELQSALQALGKSTVLRKIESVQTISQLLNPKTILTRNPVSNELFYRLERVNKYVSSPIDFARSKLTGGERMVTFRTGGQGGYWEGFFKGVKAGWKGVNPAGLTTQFDLAAPAFKVGLNRAKNASNIVTKTLGGAVDVAESTMAFLEKSLGATLKGFDYAAYNRAYKQTIGEMAELKAINSGLSGLARKAAVQEFVQSADRNILDIADQYGKYVTFQDDNLISKGLSGVKRGLNLGKEWGLGSLVVKYPKTPGALIMRGLEYSPAGFLKSAYEVAKPLIKGGKINAREATMALSRAITGSLGLTGLGYYLADKGVITGRTDKDADVRELQKDAGAGSYKVNLSALQRWAMSGFDSSALQNQENDLMYSYDWAQPIAMAISFGANINTNLKENKGALNNTGATIASSMEGALGTIAEQPVLQGITRLFQGYDLGQNLTRTAQDIPSSFTPTLLNQIRQFQDNTGRSTYSPDPLKSALNKAQAKIPGKSGELPASYGTLGQKKENYQNGSNNLFNVFLNPGFASRNNPTPVQKEILRLYDATGGKTQFPTVADKSFTWKDFPKFILNEKEYPQFQKVLGEETQKLFNKAMNSEGYKKLADEDKANKLAGLISEAKEKAKFEIIKGRGISDNFEIMKAPSSVTYNKQTVDLTFDQQKKYADLVAKYKSDLLKSAQGQASYKERQQEWDELIERKARDAAAKQIKIDIFRK